MRIIHTFRDQDYISKLSKEEREWLKEFNNQFYGANYNKNSITPKDKVEAQKKKDYLRENAARRDLFLKGKRIGGGEVLDQISNEDYKEALEGAVTNQEGKEDMPKAKLEKEYFDEKLGVTVKKYETPKFKSDQKISSTGKGFYLDTDLEERKMVAQLDAKKRRGK